MQLNNVLVNKTIIKLFS